MPLLLILFGSSVIPDVYIICLVCLVASYIISIVCIVQAFVTMNKNENTTARGLKWGLGGQIVLFKFLFLPYFIVTAFVLFVVLLGGTWGLFAWGVAMPPLLMGIPILWAVGGLFCLLDYMILLATSSYSVSTIIRAYKTNTIKLGHCISFIVLQLVFVADMISYPIIVKYIKHKS